jgi:MFS family permease
VVLARPAYRRLFAAQTISRWGDIFNTVALVVLVFRLTGSGLGVTGAVIAEIAPVLLLAPLAGAVIDRLPRIRVMIAADLWGMALAGLLPLVDRHLFAVYAVAFGLAAGGVFFNPGRQLGAAQHRGRGGAGGGQLGAVVGGGHLPDRSRPAGRRPGRRGRGGPGVPGECGQLRCLRATADRPAAARPATGDRGGFVAVPGR